MRHLLRDCQAATSIEYAFIAAVVILVMLGGLAMVGNSSTGLWGNVSSKAAQHL